MEYMYEAGKGVTISFEVVEVEAGNWVMTWIEEVWSRAVTNAVVEIVGLGLTSVDGGKVWVCLIVGSVAVTGVVMESKTAPALDKIEVVKSVCVQCEAENGVIIRFEMGNITVIVEVGCLLATWTEEAVHLGVEV